MCPNYGQIPTQEGLKSTFPLRPPPPQSAHITRLFKHTLPLLAFPLSPAVTAYLTSLLLLRHLYEKGFFTALLTRLRHLRRARPTAPARPASNS